MTESARADALPELPSQQQKGRRRATRRIINGVMFVALTAGVFGLLPRLGGLTHDAAALRHARPALVAAAIVAQAISLSSYALLYRRVLASLGVRLRFWLTVQVTLASFLVSHVTPFGSATGTLLNVSTLETQGVAASTTSEGIGLTSLVSTVALLGLFLAGFAATAGRHLSRGYLIIAGIALALVGLVAAIALMVGAHPPVSLSEPGAGRPCGRGTSGPASIQSKWPGPASVLRRSPGRR